MDLFFLKIEEGSQSASGDPAGLGESENERVASVEPSPNRGGLCEENSKKVNYLLLCSLCGLQGRNVTAVCMLQNVFTFEA